MELNLDNIKFLFFDGLKPEKHMRLNIFCPNAVKSVLFFTNKYNIKYNFIGEHFQTNESFRQFK